MSESTIQYLFSKNRLRVGDTLEINKERLRDSPNVEDGEIDVRESNPNFWRCSITARTKETDEVKWEYDDQHYPPTTLVNRIAARLSDEDYLPSEIGYWTHPRYDGANLWDLRKLD